MKTAVVLYNMGAPERAEAVRPFLYKLFNDPAIFKIPSFLRSALAHVLSRRREKSVQEKYNKLGGGSPLLANTQAQAWALEKTLFFLGDVRVFIAMRYTKPEAEDVLKKIKAFNPECVVHVPLYPQFSFTTTGSSLSEARRCGLLEEQNPGHIVIEKYPALNGFITVMAKTIIQALIDSAEFQRPLVLFSAHGLPEKNSKDGDPYQNDCEETAAALRKNLPPSIESVLCYQSKVGPMKWIGPSTVEMIIKAGQQKRPVIIVPVSFVSEHSETLVELGMEYRELAERCGVPFYEVIPTVGTSEKFIESLAEMIKAAMIKKGCLKESGVLSR